MAGFSMPLKEFSGLWEKGVVKFCFDQYRWMELQDSSSPLLEDDQKDWSMLDCFLPEEICLGLLRCYFNSGDAGMDQVKWDFTSNA